MIMIRVVRTWLLIVALFLPATSGWAQSCTTSTGGQGVQFQMPALITVSQNADGTYSFSPSDTFTLTGTPTGGSYTCSEALPLVAGILASQGQVVDNFTLALASIPWLAYSVTYNSNLQFSSSTTPFAGALPNFLPITYSAANVVGPYTVKLKVISTPTTGGTMQLLGQIGPSNGTTLFGNIFLSWQSTIQVTKQTCTVTTPSVSVSLGNVPASALPSIGSTSQQVPFNIGISCAGGDGTGVPVSITFTDPSGTTPNGFNTLYPSPDSTASGAYIQILYQGVPVNFSADTSHGNPNAIRVGNAQNGSFNIPLTARYIRGITAKGIDLTPGTANGLAQFVMDYQ
jgi:type 1 fimbria pilin